MVMKIRKEVRGMQAALRKINRYYAGKLTKPQAMEAKQKSEGVIKAYFVRGEQPRKSQLHVIPGLLPRRPKPKVTEPQALRTMQAALREINRFYAGKLTKPQALEAKRKAEEEIKAYFARRKEIRKSQLHDLRR